MSQSRACPCSLLDTNCVVAFGMTTQRAGYTTRGSPAAGITALTGMRLGSASDSPFLARRPATIKTYPHYFRPDSTPAGSSFAFVGRGDPLLLLLLFKAMLFGRAGKSGRPPPLKPSLKVHRDIVHNQSSGFAIAPRGSKASTRAGPQRSTQNGVSRNQRRRPVRWPGLAGTHGSPHSGSHQRPS
jgi:hypothetical protein